VLAPIVLAPGWLAFRWLRHEHGSQVIGGFDEIERLAQSGDFAPMRLEPLEGSPQKTIFGGKYRHESNAPPRIERSEVIS
jgi:hypothetical protein